MSVQHVPDAYELGEMHEDAGGCPQCGYNLDSGICRCAEEDESDRANIDSETLSQP